MKLGVKKLCIQKESLTFPHWNSTTGKLTQLNIVTSLNKHMCLTLRGYTAYKTSEPLI